ncbi:hypothetical protein ACN47E_002188 [Coniothyrium glycines]
MSVDNFLAALKNLQPFPSDKFVNRLYNKARQAPTADVFRDKLPGREEYGPDQNNLFIDNVDFSAQLKLLAEHALVKGLARFDSGTDKHGLKNCANTDNAEIVGDSLFNQTSTLLYSEHINWSLKGLGSKDLRELRNDSEFAKNLDAQLRSEHFIKGALRQDLVNHDHTYTMALLWTYDYVHLGPGFTPHLDGDFTSAPSGGLLMGWTKELFEGIDSQAAAKVTLNVSKAATLVHALTNSNSNTFPASAAQQFSALVAHGVFSDDHVADVQPHLDELINADGSTWKSITGQNKAAWDNTMQGWADAVASKATESQSHTDEISNGGEQFGEGMLLALTAGQIYHQNWRTTTTTGQQVADWINQGTREYSSLFKASAPGIVDTNDFVTNGSPPKSCFVADTLVATEKGSVAIQSLREGDHVLTSADPIAYGVLSDEEVVHSLGSTLLCGINDDEPFFTAGHIFHTTSGLRAVDPFTAKSENPWMNVNQLAPGHIIYRRCDSGNGYNHVEIEKITRKRMDHVKVYGVHLREGARSYHANGYLVAVNYPEITMKSIAKVLATFPKQTQVQLLQSIKELRPLFARFGAETMSEALTQELHGNTPDRALMGRPQKPVKSRTLTANLRNAKRSFVLHGDDDISDLNYRLPLVTINDGNVLLDGVAQHRATIDRDNKTVRWTRALPEKMFEHGRMHIFNHGFAGNGAILLSDDALSANVAQHKARVIRFHAAKPNASLDGVPRAANHEHHTHVAKFLKAKHTFQKFTTIPTTDGRENGATIRVAKTTMAPMVSSSVSIPGLEVNAAAPPPGIAVPGDYIDNEDIWSLGMNKSIWEAKAPLPSIDRSNIVSLGQVSFSTYHSGGANGIPVPILTLPLLDQLCSEMNAKHLKDKPQLGSLYSSHVEMTKNGTQMGVILVDAAALIYELADKPQGKQELDSLINLTFKKSIQSDIVLPLLFRTLSLELSANFGSIRGAALEYNNDHRGGDGQRHFVFDYDPVPTTIRSMAITSRKAISNTLAESRQTPVGLSAKALAAPAPVTFAMATETPLSTAELEGITGYNSVSLHNTTQALLQNTMEFHMNADARTNFLQTEAPKSLPDALGKNLDDSLKKWVRETYGPAYVSFMIAQVKGTDETRKWREPLTDADKEKVWYWWQGSGAKCLSMASEYNKLNALVAVHATRQLYGDILNRYINDGGPEKGGSKWADQMLTDLTASPHAMRGYLRAPVGSGEVVLNKYCNIMNALDPTGTKADEFFNRVVAYAVAYNIQNPYFPLDKEAAEKQKEWLSDAMRELIIKVLNKDSSLPSTVSAELKKDLDKLITDWGIDDTKTQKLIADELVTKSAELVGDIVMYMTYLGDGFKALARLSAFKSATATVNQAIAKIPGAKQGGFPYLKGMMLIVTTASYVFAAITEFNNWDHLTGPQRATAIISVLATALDVAEKSFSVFKDIKEWRASKYTESPLPPNEAIGAGQLDESLSEKIGSPEGAVELAAANKATENKTLRESSEKNINVDEQPRVSSNTGARNIEEVEPEGLIRIQRDQAPPEGLAPSGRTPWKKFTVGERLLKCANIAIGIAFTISMSLDLKNNWDSYNDVGKALNVVQVAIQGLTVLVDAAILIGDAAIAGGYLAAESTLMVALPVLGAVLALIGVIVMVVLMFVKTTKDQEPPLSPVEEFLKNVAHPLINTWSTPPAPALAYSFSPNPSHTGQNESIKITATNNSDKAVSLTRTTITMEVGGDDDALFSAPTSDWTQFSGSAAEQPLGSVNSDHTDLYTGTLTPQHRGTTFTAWDYTIAGLAKDGISGKLVVQPKQSVVVSWLGTINKLGSSLVSVVETLENGDNTRIRTPLLRL